MEKEFVEVDIVCSLGPEHPGYQKPDIGTRCVVLYKQFLSWEDVGQSCLPNPEKPTEWTNIYTPIGMSTISVPYEEVKGHIEAAYRKKKAREEKEMKEHKDRIAIADQFSHRLVTATEAVAEALRGRVSNP